MSAHRPPCFCAHRAPQPRQPHAWQRTARCAARAAHNGACASAVVAAGVLRGAGRSSSRGAAPVAPPLCSTVLGILGFQAVVARRAAARVAAATSGGSPQDEAALLRAELAAALAERDKALAERDKEQAARVKALAERDKEQAARVESELDAFEARLQGMSGTGSESATGGDVARRGAPPVALQEDFLECWPEPLADAVQAAWSALCEHLVRSGADMHSVSESGSFEIRRVHPPVNDALLAAMGAGTCKLRLWRGVVAADSVVVNETKADFVFTHMRDRLPSLLGAAVLVEVKQPGNLQNAITQALNYARRRMRELFAAARLHGDVPLHELVVYAVATDGWEVVVLRVTSGAPEAGGNYKTATPCPSFKSLPLPLLPGWDFATAAGDLPHTPPPGFAALARVLCADVDTLVGVTAAPLPSVLIVECSFGDGDDADADVAADDDDDDVAAPLELRLGSRLGCGGSSDAYVIATDTPPVPTAPWAGAVLKLARGATAKLVKMFKAEQHALRVLEGTPGVPRLLLTGHRSRGDPRGLSASMFPVRWPLLLMSPLGTPLDGELAARLAAARAAGAPSAGSVRRAFADEVLSGVHVALRAAHAARLVHCDVRPSNVAVADGASLLLDWGLARATGADAAGFGDALFALDPVFLQATYAACEWQDLASAALLWVAIARGAGASCAAPWREHGDAGRTLDERRAWLRAAADTGDAAVAAVLERLERAEARRDLTAGDYEWRPPL